MSLSLGAYISTSSCRLSIYGVAAPQSLAAIQSAAHITGHDVAAREALCLAIVGTLLEEPVGLLTRWSLAGRIGR